ncbi:HIT family protein [bacterium]|nr:HIT family protein [candidate division CSSED10-310 bacterium]
MDHCPFCSINSKEIILQNELCQAIYDRYPVSRGHMLILPKRHFADFFDITDSEMLMACHLIKMCQIELNCLYQPGGFNIGVNIGKTAGQTIGHVHFHLIPRYPGDNPDPVGGVRHVIPEKANYLRGKC